MPAHTPETEATPLPPEPFADELPPDFWGDTLAPPDTPQADPDRRFQAPSDTPPQSAAKPLEGTLESDPRFILLQELFPGRISDWQSAETPASATVEGTDDALEGAETVDLEAGLETDDTD